MNSQKDHLTGRSLYDILLITARLSKKVTLMHIVVCDDNRYFGEELADFINRTITSSEYYDNSFSTDYFSSSKDALEYIKKNGVDILFLDISMPEIDGFEIAEYFCEASNDTYLIFVSNFEDRVFNSFKYRPFRFVRKSNYKTEITEALNAAVADASLKSRCIMIQKHNDIIPIRISRIIFAEKKKQTNYIEIHCFGDTYLYRCTLEAFEAEIKNSNFAKPANNALVNLEHVEGIKDRTVKMKCGYDFFISSPKYYKLFSKRFLEFMRG